MVFGAGNSDGGTAKDGIAAMHEPRRFEEERVGIGIRGAGVVEVGSVLHAHEWLNRPLDDDFRICGNFEGCGLAGDERNRQLLKSSGQVVFIHPIGIGRGGGDDYRFANADSHGHG